MGELIADIEGAELFGDPQTVIEQLEYDSRLVKENGMFFAVQGYARDGFEFVGQAKEAGAVAVMGEKGSCPQIDNYVRVPDIRKGMSDASARFYNYPGFKIDACGVTGTNGKTTTCHLIKAILEASKKKTGLITTQVYDIGTERFPGDRTTPESLDLQRLIYLMKSNDCANVVVEVSSHGLVLHRVDNIDFRVAVFTNLTRDHLDFHKDMKEYFEAKRLLVKKLKREEGSCVVVNLDVEEFRPLLQEKDVSILTYSLDNDSADVHCTEYDLQPERTSFDLVTPKGSGTVKLQMPGRFNLQNALAAAAAGIACGIGIDSVVKGLESGMAIPGRLNSIDCGQPFSIYVDFAHTPDAISRLCETVRELTKGRILLLFGCGGDRDRGKRPLMGKAAMEGADYVIVTSDNPRSEEPESIIDEIKPALVADKSRIMVDRRQAIEAILDMATENDTVILAGKGSENYQEVKGVRTAFSDVGEAKTVLARLGYVKSEVDRES